jgi:hypothetical protein
MLLVTTFVNGPEQIYDQIMPLVTSWRDIEVESEYVERVVFIFDRL